MFRACTMEPQRGAAGRMRVRSLRCHSRPRGRLHGALCSGRLYPRARVGHRGMHRAVEHGRRLTAAGTLETGGALSLYKNTFLCKRHPRRGYREDARRTRQGAALTTRGEVRTLSRGSVSRPPTLPSWWVPARREHTRVLCACVSRAPESHGSGVGEEPLGAVHHCFFRSESRFPVGTRRLAVAVYLQSVFVE